MVSLTISGRASNSDDTTSDRVADLGLLVSFSRITYLLMQVYAFKLTFLSRSAISRRASALIKAGHKRQ
ncbi:hypothetical protein RB1931 [Rhodopirellula baltica SH 1]|uniref:Uncharacterized protein n=1 Tax=Rhodopirellula baltica (strain DSM 10527 / NCIMB 13988 / SH1) TaxID=243090 RepID=Q7UWM3_RHOBA|nr:hypothetical protein RB1931 [Rhodopirellula baltica SH 1]